MILPKFLFPTALLFLSMINPIFQFVPEKYEWKVDIVTLEQDGFGATSIRQADFSCSSTLSNGCSALYARLNILYKNEATYSLDITPIVSPRIYMLLKTEENQSLHIPDVLVAESNDCKCLNSLTYKWVNVTNGQEQQICLVDSMICDKVFLAPVPITNNTTSAEITIETAETGLYIPRTSFTFYNMNFQVKRTQLKEISLESLTLSSVNLTSLNIVPSTTKSWALSVNDHILLSDNEFESFYAFKLSVDINELPVICSNWTVEIKDMMSLPDRMLIASKYGLLEYMDNAASQSPSKPVIVLNACVKNLKSVNQRALDNYLVMAVTDASESVFYGNVMKGTNLKLRQALDSMNRTCCKAFADKACQIIAVATTKNRPNKIIFLTHSIGYRIVEFSVDTKTFVSINNFSDNLGADKFAGQFFSEAHTLSGMAFTQSHSDHLFLWGSALFYSPNSGLDIFKLAQLGDFIEVFIASQKGDYAAITLKRQVFLGKVGTSSLRKLHLDNEMDTLAFFFDSVGTLFQLTYNGTSGRITKKQIPLKHTLQRDDFGISTHSNRRLCHHLCKGNCTEASLNCISEVPNSYTYSRSCPFARITARSFNYQFFTRTPVIIHCRDKLTGKWIVGLRSIRSDQYEIQNIKAGSNLYENCLWESTISARNSIPKAISIGLNSCYYFEVDLYLDYYEYADVYTHQFGMEDLVLSISFSNPENLIARYSREVNYTENYVGYKVHICDSGKQRQQRPPGVGQEIVSTDVKATGAGLNCIASSYQDQDVIQGHFMIDVSVGCPSIQKVIFDSKSSEAKGGNHYCDSEEEVVPCFHFDIVFRPVFRLVDEATLSNEEFTGNYTLVIVGGGTSLNDISEFSSEDQEKFNFQTGPSLIWAPQTAYSGRPVYNKTSNSLRWLCGNQSPCSGITPKFPKSAEYYFLVEFSNRNVDKSNCDFTFRFTIKIHGLLPGSLDPSLIIVLACLGSMVFALLVGFILRKYYSHVFERLHCTESILHCIRSTRNKVGSIRNRRETENIELPTENHT